MFDLFCPRLCLFIGHFYVLLVYFVLVGELIFTWHIYYLHVLLVTYSVQNGLFNGLFCTHTTTCWYKFSFYCLFSIFTSPWRAYFYIYNAVMSADLICSTTLSWWPILYIWTFLKAYSVYILPHSLQVSWLSLYHFDFGEPICILVAYSVHQKLFDVFFCALTSPCWPKICKHNLFLSS